ncbi:unnamed protein product [Cladocopium goreaui]|uniref:Uncharacterized protein n=1 Tax=Cladocopium goreaui TaxID=2562237 RepID=A0A9P1CTX4_9DINO|nr:unnamed protein product [Cladocopium goreaui]
MSYTQVFAGRDHTVLVRSDGSAVTCGTNEDGQCDISSPEPGSFYIGIQVPPVRDLIMQLECIFEADVFKLKCSTLVGEEKLCWNAHGFDLAWDIHKHVCNELKISLQSLRLVLPLGQLLTDFCHQNPVATVADLA